MQEAILEVLQARFGALPDAISERPRSVRAQRKLKMLVKHPRSAPTLRRFGGDCSPERFVASESGVYLDLERDNEFSPDRC